MQPFERDSIQSIIGDSRIADDIRAQLPFLSVVDRTRGGETHTTRFAVSPEAPAVIPGDAEIGADLDVDAYGTVSAYLTISDGHVTSLVFEAVDPHWAEHPRILGVVS